MTSNPKKAPRIRRNPKTRTKARISPHLVVVFKPSAILTRQINNPATRGDIA
jgi:nucleoid DNA-binding protein